MFPSPMRRFARPIVALLCLVLAFGAGTLEGLLIAGSQRPQVWATGPEAHCALLSHAVVENKTGREFTGDWQCVEVSPAVQTRITAP